MESSTVNREAVIKSLLTDSNTDGQPRKRRRLDNLTAEERALRRKLKNRVAAQTARDRKKARMTELEEQVEELERQNRLLHEQNRRLQKQTTSLTTENAELRIRLGLTPPGSPDTQSTEPLSPLSSVPSPSGSEDSEYNVVIKKEVEFEEYASLSVSQQQEHLILFLSMITTFLTVNSSLTYFWICLSMLSQKRPSPFYSPAKKRSHSLVAVRKVPMQPLSLAALDSKGRAALTPSQTSMKWLDKHQATWNHLKKS